MMKAKSAKMMERLYPGLLSGILRPQNDGMKTYLGFSGINWDSEASILLPHQKIYLLALYVASRGIHHDTG